MFPEKRLSALVVDDDPDVIEFMSNVLAAANCQVATATDGEQALEQSSSVHPDIVFLDIAIPEQDGWLVCSKLKMLENAPPIVLITGRTAEDTDRFADFVHADRVLRKPFSAEAVLRVIDEMCPAVAND